MGISGANFMVAETGTIVLVTNEGNGRMCTTLPPLHVAIAGIDKVVPDMQSLSVVLKLLARSATGQKISTYTSFIRGPRQIDGENGPQEFHLILLDNGRTRILQDEVTRETMLCIRCGACLNVCPVYNHVGGHAYGWVYSGPIGSILSPQLLGTSVAADLPFASSLCGACGDVCPVKIPIPKILLHLRHRVVEGDQVEAAMVPAEVQAGMTVGAMAYGTPWLYQLGTLLLPLVQKSFQRRRVAAQVAAADQSLDEGATVPGVWGGFPRVVEAAHAPSTNRQATDAEVDEAGGHHRDSDRGGIGIGLAVDAQT